MSTHRLRVLSLIVALVVRGFAQDNQCFYAANQRAGSIIVPCSSNGPYASCCQLGDLCLSDSACWNPQYNVTYLYGCTDASYQDFTCPYKCGPTFGQCASISATVNADCGAQRMRHMWAWTTVPTRPIMNGLAPTPKTTIRPFNSSISRRNA